MSTAPEMLPLALSSGSLVHPTRPSTYAGTVSADFCYASAKELPTAHGGYIGTIILQAIRQHFQISHPKLNQLDTFTVHFRYLEASNAGDISVNITEVKMGKNTSTVHFAASQDDTVKIVGYATQFDAWGRVNTGFSSPTPPLLSPPPLAIDFTKLA